MTTVLLVRHGEAVLAQDGDGALTARGVTQAQRLGTWLSDMGFLLDAVCSGPLLRQRDTARHLASSAAAAGHRSLEPQVIDGFAELPGFDIVQCALPQLLADEPETTRAEFVRVHGPDCVPSLRLTPLSVMQRALERWAMGQLELGDVESFAAFEARVRHGLAEVIRQHAGAARVAVVTSAGPIAVGLRVALGVPPALTMDLGRGVVNSSLTELWFDEERFKLLAFNVVGHLHRDEITTMLGPTPGNPFASAGVRHATRV